MVAGQAAEQKGVCCAKQKKKKRFKNKQAKNGLDLRQARGTTRGIPVVTHCVSRSAGESGVDYHPRAISAA
jgi:hypothetical protein